MPGKKQHIIPQLHLRYFRGNTPKDHVWTYDSQAEEPRSAKPENTAVETHFYSFEMEDGTMNTIFDDYLTNVESKAAPIYKKIIEGFIPDENQEKADFSTFLAMMYFRTTTMRKMNAELYGRLIQIQTYATAAHEGAFESSIKRFEESTKEKLSDEVKVKIREDMLDPSGYELHVPKERALISMQGADKLMNIFFDMKWSVGEAEHHFFVTSDNPLIKRSAKNTYHRIYGDGGFLNKTTQVTFPLSPKRLLILTWNNSVSTIFPIPRKYVYEENLARAAHSDRCLYSHIQHKKLMKLTHDFKDVRPKMTSGGLGPKNFSEVKVPRKWKK